MQASKLEYFYCHTNFGFARRYLWKLSILVGKQNSGEAWYSKIGGQDLYEVVSGGASGKIQQHETESGLILCFDSITREGGRQVSQVLRSSLE